jgi:hypothetical protein
MHDALSPVEGYAGRGEVSIGAFPIQDSILAFTQGSVTGDA